MYTNVDNNISNEGHFFTRHFGFSERDTVKITTVALVMLLAAYSVFTLAMIPLHEPWRDESQAWLIARDASLRDLFSTVLREEGHPALWFLILMPFAKLGAPYVSLQIISAALMIAALATLYASDIPVVVKIIAPITCLFIYEIPTIARSYSVLALLCALLVMDYPHRNNHPYRYALWLALLFQTHVWAFGFTGGMFIVWLYEAFRNRSLREKKDYFAFLLPVLSALLSVVELFPDGNNSPQITALSDWYLIKEGLVFIVLFIIGTSLGAVFVALCTMTWVIIVINLVYFGINTQKACALLWMLVTVALTLMLHDGRKRLTSTGWIQRITAMIVSIALMLTLIPKTRLVWYDALTDVRYTTSVGKQFAHTLSDDIATTGIDIIVPVRDATSVYAVSNSLPYLSVNVRMWNPFTGEYLSYATQQYRDLTASSDEPRLLDSDLPRNVTSSQVLFVDCTGTNGTGHADILDSNPEYHEISHIHNASASNDTLVPDAIGISCRVYQHD